MSSRASSACSCRTPGCKSWNGISTPRSSRCGWATATRSMRIRGSIPSPSMMSYRGRAWIELAGCLVLALPYMALVAYYSLDFVAQSYRLGEQSDSTVGLTHRWIIKGIYAAGLWMVVLGILSVLLRVIVFLFGGKSEAGSQSADRPCDYGRLVRTGGHQRARLAGRQSRHDHVRVDVFLHFHRLPGRLHHGRTGARLCRLRRLARHVQADRPVRYRAAHVGRGRQRSGAGVDPHVHLHGRDPGAIGLGQGHAGRNRGPAEVVPGRAGGLRDGDGHDPGGADRRGRRGGDHAVGDRAAADAGRGLRQAACHRHHRLGRNARHPHSAGHHAGGDGGDAVDLGRQPVSRRHHAGLPAFRPLPRLYRARRHLQAGRGAQAAARTTGRRPAVRSGAPSGGACSR